MPTKKTSDMKKEREKIINELRSLEHLLKPEKVSGEGIKEKIRSTMESVKECERHMYDQDPSAGNLLTQMCLMLHDTKASKAVNDETLAKFPENISAKQLEIEILVLKNNIASAKKKLDQLKHIADRIESKEPDAVFELCVHKADVAMYYYHIGPKNYVKAIELYEEAVNESKKLTDWGSVSKPTVDMYLVVWNYKLVHLYNRMLNQGNIKSHGGSKKWTPIDVFHKLCIHVGQVLKSCCKHNTYCARAYIEIVDAHQKLKGNVTEQTSHFIKNAIGQLKIKDQWCIRKAQQLAPDDGSVLEKAGRYYRIHASNLKQFEEAERILKRCIDLHPTRHVAMHQLSQLYKSMWFEVNDFAEAKLHRNPVRSGQKAKSRDYRSGRGRGRQPDAYSQLAAVVGQGGSGVPTHSEPRMCDVHAGGSEMAHMPCNDDGFEEDEGVSGLSLPVKTPTYGSAVSSSTTPSVNNFSGNEPVEIVPLDFSKIKIRPGKPVAPKRPVPFGRLPSHVSKPDYFDTLRTSNPRCGPNTVRKDYLENAIVMLERASEAAKETSIKYHVDLARLYISMERLEDAEDRFVKAQEQLGSATHHERAYLYEQWALSKDHSGASGEELDDIKNMYREAVVNSVAAREKSKMAFYQLKDIIESQLVDKPNDLGIKTEQALLQKLVENFDHAKGRLRDILEKDSKNVELLWNLIDILYQKGQYLESFKYLKMVFPLQGPGEMKFWHLGDESMHPVDPVSVTVKAIETIEDTKNYISKDMLKSLFVALTNPKDCEIKLDNVFFFDDRCFSDFTRLLHGVFEEFNFRVIDSLNNPELLVGKPAHVAYDEQTLQNTMCVLVIADSLQDAEGDCQKDTGAASGVWTIPKEMLHLHHLEGEAFFRPILVTAGELSEEWNKLPRLKNSPKLSIKDVIESGCSEEAKWKFIENFLRAVYDNIQPPDEIGETDSDD